MKKKSKLPQLVIIQWIDAHSMDAWSESLDSKVQHCISAGYLVAETDESYVVSAAIGLSVPVTYACCLTIPRVCVTKIQRLPH